LNEWRSDLRLSLSNGIFSRYPLAENIAAVRELGFENLEFNMKSVRVENDISAYAAKRLVDVYGLKCLTLHAATVHVEDKVEVHRAVYYGKISLEFARLLQAPVMVVHSNVSRKLPEAARHRVLALVFGELSAYARRLKVKLALENLSYASSGYGKNVAQIEEILSIIDDGSMGIALDFCHAEATGQTLSLLEKYKNKIFNIHISNRAHRAFSDGTPNLKALLTKLQDYGYSGPLTMELNRKCTTEEILETKLILKRILDGK
jgi:sugar phosphate isomerase/epimerase